MDSIGSEVEQILTYIKKSDNGRRWVDLTREFEENQEWSHGKFVNHWKKTEPYREQVMTENGKRYFIKKGHNDEVNKLVFVNQLSSALSKGQLHEVEISDNRMRSISNNILEEMTSQLVLSTEPNKDDVKIVSDKIVKKMKKNGASKDEIGFAPASTYIFSKILKALEKREPIEKSLEILSKLIKVRIITEKGETPIILTDEQLEQIFKIIAFNLIDPNKKELRSSVHILASLQLPKKLDLIEHFNKK